MAEKQDPYAHRKHRQKYKLGYGAEGAARGKNELPEGSTDPRQESDDYKSEMSETEHTDQE